MKQCTLENAKVIFKTNCKKFSKMREKLSCNEILTKFQKKKSKSAQTFIQSQFLVHLSR